MGVGECGGGKAETMFILVVFHPLAPALPHPHTKQWDT